MSGETAQRTLVREHRRIPKFFILNLEIVTIYTKDISKVGRKMSGETDLSTVFRTKNHAIFCKFSYSTGDK